MSDSRQRTGKRGEELARRHLEAKGYSIVATNYRAREGEIDIVAEDKGTLVFVEVRTTSGAGFGTPAESVTERKRSHLVATAEQYMQVNGVPDRDWRIDVVAVQLGPGDAPARLEVIENAVEL